MNKFPSSRFSEDDYIMGLFYAILSAHPDLVQRYKTDLIHDGLWLAEHVLKEDSTIDTFYYGLRESGTSIGTSPMLSSYSNSVLYHIEVTRRADHCVYAKAEQVDMDTIERPAA